MMKDVVDLDVMPFTEANLQTHFEHWESAQEVRIGVPLWLKNMRAWKGQPSLVDAWGVSFRPDVVAHDGEKTYVFELKYARKYEPLALAEVLHHAHALRAQPYMDWPQLVQPVIVSQFNAWVRDAWTYLRESQLDEKALRVIEVTALRQRAGVGYLWFNEVDGVDPWTPIPSAEVPANIQVHLSPRQGSRCFKRESGVFACLEGEGSGNPDAYENVSQRWVAKISELERSYAVWEGISRAEGTYRIECG